MEVMQILLFVDSRKGNFRRETWPAWTEGSPHNQLIARMEDVDSIVELGLPPLHLKLLMILAIQTTMLASSILGSKEKSEEPNHGNPCC